MACRFALPVSDAAELSVRANAVPSNTKSMTEWGVRVWTEWASSRAVSPAPDGVVSVVTPLLAMTPEHLAYWMGKFVLEVRRKMERNTRRKRCTRWCVASSDFLNRMVSLTLYLQYQLSE